MALDPEQPVSQVASLEQLLTTRSAEPRFQTELMASFAALALMLAVVGIYGVIAYAVSQRRHEIGVRMALGATPGDVRREMLGQGMKLTAIGIAIGIGGALGVATVLKSVLVGVSATDPMTIGGVALTIAVVAALACYVCGGEERRGSTRRLHCGANRELSARRWSRLLDGKRCLLRVLLAGCFLFAAHDAQESGVRGYRSFDPGARDRREYRDFFRNSSSVAAAARLSRSG